MRRALVTGASSGIGLAFARELAASHDALVLVARDEQRLRRIAAELPGQGHEILPADLASEEGWETVARRLEQDDAPVDVLVNAAGRGTWGSYPDVALGDEEAQLNLNVTAVLRLSWVGARAFRRRGGGGIVNVSSTAAVWSTGTYAATKAWVLRATEGLAAAVEGDSVAVVCVLPGFTRTEFHERSGVDNSGIPSWLWLDPRQVARQSLQALSERRTVCIPGWQYRLLLPLVGALPMRSRRWLLRRVAPLRPDPATTPTEEGRN